MSDFNNNKDNQPGGGQPGGFNMRPNRMAVLFMLLMAVVLLFVLSNAFTTSANVVPYSQFDSWLDNGSIQEVDVIGSSLIQGRTRDGLVFTTRIPGLFDEQLLQRLRESGVANYEGQLPPTSPLEVIFDFLPIILILVFFWLMFRQMQGGGGNRAFSFGKSKAKLYNSNDKKTTYNDVAGQQEAKYELQEVVEFLKNPGKFTKMGAKIPKGVLLIGGPGTGKTLLAKATAGEAGVPFFHMSGSDFVEMFVGVGASRVRDLFEQGRKNAPCILFIDELDAVGRTRGAGYGGGHDEREQTLNQMLVEMDGFDTKDGVIIIAATNRPDVLDPALLRPGRFDRQVVVDNPDVDEREAILKIHAAKIPLAADMELRTIARATPGASGADLANIVNEAALFAARKDKKSVDREDFEEAHEKILMGVARKSRVITPDQKLKTARHEAGHALLHYYLDDADDLHKVTVIPRGRAAGVAFSLPKDDGLMHSEAYLHDRIAIIYGGYIAEKMFYDVTTTGPSSDIKQATNLARRMVCEWGMSSLGPISFGAEEEPIFLAREIARHKDYSEDTARKIDDEVNSIIDGAFKRAEKILNEHKDQLEQLAQALVERETLTDDEVRELLGFEPKAKGSEQNL